MKLTNEIWEWLQWKTYTNSGNDFHTRHTEHTGIYTIAYKLKPYEIDIE